MKKRERELLEAKSNDFHYEVQLEIEQRQIPANTPRKKEEFIRAQEEFLARKMAGIERSKQSAENKMAEACTYKPEINENSRRMTERQKNKVSGSPVILFM